MTKNRTLVRLLLLVVLFALSPRVASAQEGWWDWIEGLSGPGPFHGYTVGYRVLCTKESEGRRAGTGHYVVEPMCFSDRDPNIRQILEVRVGHFNSDDNPRFSDTPSDTREVTGLKLDAFMRVRVNSMLDAGAGVGRIRFSGDGFESFWRTTVTPVSLTFTPLALGEPDDVKAAWWRRVLKIRYDMNYFHTGFTGADFGSAATKYSTVSDWSRTVAIELDFGGLLER